MKLSPASILPMDRNAPPATPDFIWMLGDMQAIADGSTKIFCPGCSITSSVAKSGRFLISNEIPSIVIAPASYIR
jgi:hypothetical protein